MLGGVMYIQLQRSSPVVFLMNRAPHVQSTCLIQDPISSCSCQNSAHTNNTKLHDTNRIQCETLQYTVLVHKMQQCMHSTDQSNHDSLWYNGNLVHGLRVIATPRPAWTQAVTNIGRGCLTLFPGMSMARRSYCKDSCLPH